MTCERCFQPEDIGEHGLYKCPLQPRPRHIAIWQDTIEGGIEIAHGLCNADGTPRRYDSRSAIRDEAKARGLIGWGEVYEESRLKDAHVHNDWLKSGEAQRARRDRVEARAEKALARSRR